MNRNIAKKQKKLDIRQGFFVFKEPTKMALGLF
jgi:hypothetical protein